MTCLGLSQGTANNGSTFDIDHLVKMSDYEMVNSSEITGNCPSPVTDECACAIDPVRAEDLGYDCSGLEILYWYHPDYLGSVEYITDMDGEAYQFFFRNPWGKELIVQNSNNELFSSPYRFNGKELDEETGNYYYGARYYTPDVSVWLSVDRMAAKYPSMSPYNFVMNNPINLVDPNGDSVNVNNFMYRHQEEWETTKADLEMLGGLTLGTSKTGNITYEINEDAKGFSQAARDKMIGAFGDKELNVSVRSYESIEGGSTAGGSLMNLDMSQIKGFIDPKNVSSDLDQRTLGFGMTFLHELGHTKLGGNLKDVNTAFGTNGENVNQMNKIRSQMGNSWGQRYYYSQSAGMDADKYIPFSDAAFKDLLEGFAPRSSFIKGSLK